MTLDLNQRKYPKTVVAILHTKTSKKPSLIDSVRSDTHNLHVTRLLLRGHRSQPT